MLQFFPSPLPCSFLVRFSKLSLLSGEIECSFPGDLGDIGDFKYLLSKGDVISNVTKENNIYHTDYTEAMSFMRTYYIIFL